MYLTTDPLYLSFSWPFLSINIQSYTLIQNVHFTLEYLENMSNATYFFPPLFKNVFARLVLLVYIRDAVLRYFKRDQK